MRFWYEYILVNELVVPCRVDRQNDRRTPDIGEEGEETEKRRTEREREKRSSANDKERYQGVVLYEKYDFLTIKRRRRRNPCN